MVNAHLLTLNITLLSCLYFLVKKLLYALLNLSYIFLLGTHNDEIISRPTSFISDQPKKSAPLRSLSLDLPKCEIPDSSHVCTTENQEKSQELILEKSPPDDCNLVEGANVREEIKNFPSVEVVYRKKESRSANNRLSVISSESDRR